MSVIIQDTPTLTEFCRRLKEEEYITVDTEFIRERTYYPQLCLVQIAGDHEAAAIDPLAPGMSLEPMLELMRDTRILKVFHAASQDLEIFYYLTRGTLPSPLYDTQIAAMVCGFGEQIGYESVVSRLCGVSLDKSQRFTDWSRRPLKAEQLEYALADVTHLREVYRKLRDHIAAQGRESWIEEETASLADPERYVTRPEEAWLRQKTRDRKPRYLARLRALAQWREEEAMRQDKPRGWILNDDALQEIAQTNPITEAALKRGRMIKKHLGQLDLKLLLLLIEGANTLPVQHCPRLPERNHLPSELESGKDLLKVLLKLKCQEHNVAARLVSPPDMLNDLLLGEENLPFMKGWRYEVFGRDAKRLLEGGITLGLQGRKTVVR